MVERTYFVPDYKFSFKVNMVNRINIVYGWASIIGRGLSKSWILTDTGPKWYTIPSLQDRVELDDAIKAAQEAGYTEINIYTKLGTLERTINPIVPIKSGQTIVAKRKAPQSAIPASTNR